MKTIRPLNEDWLFAKCENGKPDPGLPLQSGETVTLPHTWYQDGSHYEGDAVYQKRFRLSLQPGQRAFLRLDGVDKACEIYLNGVRLGSHEGGYTRFALEMTEHLVPEENLLTVLVNNERGTSVSPLSGDFTLFGGITRRAELLITESACFDPCYWGSEGVLFRPTVDPETGEGILRAEPHVSGKNPTDLTVRYILLDPDGGLILEKEGKADQTTELRIPSPRLWNGKRDPALYTVRAELVRGDALLDTVCLRTGFRSFRADPDQGFFLNGKYLKLHGVAKHQDTAEVFSAASEEDWQRDLALIREIGANTLRLSHYPHPSRVYDLCDEMGLVVWAEIPMLKLNQSDALLENAKKQLTEMICQQMHHPAICFWGIQNEVGIFGQKPWMEPRLRELNELAHQLDPSRLTTSANEKSTPQDNFLNQITDIQAYNIYFGWYYGHMADHAAFLDDFHRVNPTRPLGISEYGVDTNPAFHSADPKVNDYTEEYQALYHETVYPFMAERDFIWGSYVWNMFDFVSAIRNAGGVQARNIKGLVTHDRRTRKDAFYYYKAQWSDEPFVRIAEKRFARRAAETISIKAYSNQKELTLRCGELSQTLRSDNGVFHFAPLPLSEDGTSVTVSAGEWSDSAVFTRVEEPDPAYIFVDTDAGLNVRNWFVDEQEEARLFPEDAYSIRDMMQDLEANPKAMEVIDRIAPAVGRIIRSSVEEERGSFTLEQALHYVKKGWTEEQVKAVNDALIQIPKK